MESRPGTPLSVFSDSNGRRTPRPLEILGVHRYDLFDWINSWCLSMGVLASMRTVVGIHSACVLLVEFFRREREMLGAARFPFYFTYISNAFLAAYFCLAGWWGWRGIRSEEYPMKVVAKKSPWTIYFLHFLYTASMTFHQLVPPVYLLLVFDPKIERTAVDWYISHATHTLPPFLLFLEFVLNRRYFVAFVEIVPVYAFILVYMLWAWAAAWLHWRIHRRPWWVYSFLNFFKEKAWILYVLLLFAVGVFFCNVWLLHKLKKRILNKT